MRFASPLRCSFVCLALRVSSSLYSLGRFSLFVLRAFSFVFVFSVTFGYFFSGLLAHSSFDCWSVRLWLVLFVGRSFVCSFGFSGSLSDLFDRLFGPFCHSFRLVRPSLVCSLACPAFALSPVLPFYVYPPSARYGWFSGSARTWCPWTGSWTRTTCSSGAG